MKHIYHLAIFFTFLTSCNNADITSSPDADTVHIYPTVSYLHLNLDADGRLPANPYVLKFENGNKQVVFCGVNHLTNYADIDNPLFKGIEAQFFEFQPSVAINEGGDVSDKVYASKKEAIREDGEIGLTKILCDSLKIKTVNGDLAELYEFQELLKTFSKGELLAYIVTERLMWGLKGQNTTDSIDILKKYNSFVQEYLIKQGGIALTETEQTFSFYQTNYQQLLHRPFGLSDLEPTNPFDAQSKFQRIGRTSKEIRDQYLISTIDKLLDSHNKIFIVFGGWHLLTCKPGIREVVDRKRK